MRVELGHGALQRAHCAADLLRELSQRIAAAAMAALGITVQRFARMRTRAAQPAAQGAENAAVIPEVHMPDTQLVGWSLEGSPPPKDAPPTPENVRALRVWLDGIIAFGATTSDRPWRFYDEVDRYLGPWGETGYPMAYGKKYCKLFFRDERLRANPAAAAWVRRTLVLLQRALADFVIQRFQAGTLAKVTPDEFKRAAFDSHPVAYTEGGLALVTMVSPLLLLRVGTIPAVEFLPWSRNFALTVEQVLITSGLLLPRCIVVLAISAAGPAHNGMLARAAAADEDEFENRLRLGRELEEAFEAVRDGRADHIGLLDELLRSLNRAQYADESLAASARRLIAAIQLRRAYVIERYRREIRFDPSLGPIYKNFDRRAHL